MRAMISRPTSKQLSDLIVYAWLLDLKRADADDYDSYVESILGEIDERTIKRISRRYGGGWSAFVREHISQCSRL